MSNDDLPELTEGKKSWRNGEIVVITGERRTGMSLINADIIEKMLAMNQNVEPEFIELRNPSEGMPAIPEFINMGAGVKKSRKAKKRRLKRKPGGKL